ncbi:hypothetical protein GY45DRAFT_692180 [Cubamyces sp. BRFM 1775]|nr:hypothetical protein GY45DRAFT_692180 [Cubamyces sp. BRFM 1775]
MAGRRLPLPILRRDPHLKVSSARPPPHPRLSSFDPRWLSHYPHVHSRRGVRDIRRATQYSARDVHRRSIREPWPNAGHYLSPAHPRAASPQLRIALSRTLAIRRRLPRLPFYRGLTYSPVPFVGIRSELNAPDAEGRGPSPAAGRRLGSRRLTTLEFPRTQRGCSEDGHRAKKSEEEKVDEGGWERMNTAVPEMGLLARTPDARRRGFSFADSVVNSACALYSIPLILALEDDCFLNQSPFAPNE